MSAAHASSIHFSVHSGQLWAINSVRREPFALKGVSWFGFEGRLSTAGGVTHRTFASCEGDVATFREGVLHSRKPLRTVRFEQMGVGTDVAKLADFRPNPT